MRAYLITYSHSTISTWGRFPSTQLCNPHTAWYACSITVSQPTSYSFNKWWTIFLWSSTFYSSFIFYLFSLVYMDSFLSVSGLLIGWGTAVCLGRHMLHVFTDNNRILLSKVTLSDIIINNKVHILLPTKNCDFVSGNNKSFRCRLKWWH